MTSGHLIFRYLKNNLILKYAARMKVTFVFALLVVFHGSAVNGHRHACVIKATTQTLERLDVEIRQMLTNNPAFIGGFVRLAFHDCVGDSCDGCIDYDNDDNAG